MKNVIDVLNERGGYLNLENLPKGTVNAKDLDAQVHSGIVVKISPKHYRLRDLEGVSPLEIAFMDVCVQESEAVICLGSALAYYGIIGGDALTVHYALPDEASPLRVPNMKTQSHFFHSGIYEAGIQLVETDYEEFRIFIKEKTLCDLFRFRKELGEDVAIQALNNYLQGEPDLDQLFHFSKICRVSHEIKPLVQSYLKKTGKSIEFPL
jgi:hypothetical protein